MPRVSWYFYGAVPAYRYTSTSLFRPGSGISMSEPTGSLQNPIRPRLNPPLPTPQLLRRSSALSRPPSPHSTTTSPPYRYFISHCSPCREKLRMLEWFLVKHARINYRVPWTVGPGFAWQRRVQRLSRFASTETFECRQAGSQGGMSCYSS